VGALLTWMVWAQAAAIVHATKAAKIVRCKPFTPENLGKSMFRKLQTF
jgi:hypothetical protein